MLKETRIETKSGRELALMREACAVVVETLKALARAAAPGISTAELDRIAASEIRRRGAKPAFLGYRGYPATLCASINEEVIHGVPREDRRLKDGDILSLDLGASVDGYFGDAAMTLAVGEARAEARKLMRTAKEALEKGVACARAGNRLGDISAAIQLHAEGCGCSVVREFVGHGIGRALHEDPAVPNFGKPGAGVRLRAGMTLAIEPMVNAGGPGVRVLEDGWTAVTADGSLSAHFEHTVVVTDGDPLVLTEGLF
ncbi:MAG: type I methionyl aminopeptidase [Elusimicrobia bacterium]|nr:type I methionyl aminopeptidase [Elusimicrobiota bacterium]